MRVKEILQEINLNIPDQMVTVQIPLSAITSNNIETDDDTIINPGKRAGEDGKYRWSPPLQQHLDATKDAVGPSNDAIDVDSAEEIEAQKDTDDQLDDLSDFKKTLAAILSRTPSVLG
jgi:hypothetical protein